MHHVARPIPGIEPCYFGSAGPDLYGCFHAPATAPAHDCGVLLCNPHGHEHIQFHRSMRRLAVLLAQEGFPALRFDFSGCGDSAGDHGNWSIQEWRENVGAAAAHLQERSKVSRICVAGIRLGGALAALACCGQRPFESVVLWDPVIRGRDYLDELVSMHTEMLRHAHVVPDPLEQDMEILGFPLPGAFRTELEHLDLMDLPALPAERLLIIESHPSAQEKLLRQCFEGRGACEVQYRRFSNPHLWEWLEDFGRVHVPLEILQEIIGWVSRKCP
jgi:pimeloyl-ACP methyl ester carboxylesterase